jgi:hypothetical protein
MRTVEQIANIWKKKAAESIFPGYDSSLVKFTGKRTIKNYKQSTAFKTGNLLRQFVAQNANPAINKIKLKNGESYEIAFVIAPRGAFYGKFVHNGTVKMGARPYMQIARDTTEVKTAVKEFMDGIPVEVLKEQTQELKKILSALI